MDYLWAPAPPMPEVKVQDYQNGHAHMRSAFQTQPSDNGRKLGGFYQGAPIAVNGGGLHSRPSYMGELPPHAVLGMPAAPRCMPLGSLVRSMCPGAYSCTCISLTLLDQKSRCKRVHSRCKFCT